MHEGQNGRLNEQPSARRPAFRVGILTHNGLHHTERCLRSLQQHTTAPWVARVLDNASSDRTPAFLASLDDVRVTVECLQENLGVSGGRNRLLEQMLPDMHDDELLVLLDNDIEVGAGWEQPFLDAYGSAPTLGVAGRWAFSMQVHDGWRDILAEHNSDSGPADTVQGCCFWIRAGAARAVGGFDMSLGRFWHEDDDYCIRALHAGWDVRRVRCAAITHHEHGSGVALRPDRVAGSIANQQYLTAKWKRMGAIDDYGRPRRPESGAADPSLALQGMLAARTGRSRPLLRTEVSAAIEDATRLLHPDVADCRATVLATPAARVLLADTATGGDGEVAERAGAALARVSTLLRQRREESAAPDATRAGTAAFSAMCNPHAWDDARWLESFTTSFHDGRGIDFYARTKTDWRDGQLMHALRVTGAFARPRRALIVGHPSERTIAALSHVVSDLTVCDGEPVSLDAVTGMAQRPLGNAALSVGAWPLPQGDPRRFDIVLCPNLSRYAPPARTPSLLRELAQVLAPNGWFGAGASVRLTGPTNGRWTERALFADDAALATAGLRRVGKFDDSVADELLLAAVPVDEGHHWRPRLARYVASHRVTLATLFCRRLGLS
ncbi:MAG: glycosyltransferase [Gemmatimonadota bacterium]